MPIRGTIMRPTFSPQRGWNFDGANEYIDMYRRIQRLRQTGVWAKLDRLWVFDGRPDQLTSIK